MLDNQKKLNKNYIHLIFLFILSLNYIVPYILFGNITLFYHDALDSEIVYNKIIGRYLESDDSSIDLFINGEIQIDFLRRIYHPIIYLYVFFDTEAAYWITDILIKITSYVSFFILAKKLNKNIFICCLIACLFATINLPTHNGLGVAIFPYLIYLSFYKQTISLKHLLIITFFGLNSDLIFTIFALPFLLIILLILSPKKFKILQSNNIKIYGIFLFSLLISNSNLILLGLSDLSFHREEFYKDPTANSDLLFIFFTNLINFVNEINFYFFYELPMIIFLPFLFILIIISKNKISKNIFYLILTIELILIFLRSDFYLEYYNNSKGMFRTLNFGYCSTILPLLYGLSSIIILNNNKKKIYTVLQIIVLFSIFFGQVNSSIVPFYKKYVAKENNYRNIYTFENYYLYEDYKKIKEIVKNQRVVSIGIDPMIAIFNDVGTIDGYHNIYPLSYKKKFRKLIEKELDQNSIQTKYFDNWGSRLYAFINDPNKILLNFDEIKKLGANFVISKYDIKDKKLKLICGNCSKYVKLYSIN